MKYLNNVINEVKTKDYNELEYIQAVEEILSSVDIIFDNHPEYEKQAVLERLLEPERVIQFKVPWEDDNGNIHVNRGFRVQYNSALGPYKGGLRFNPSVNLSIMKFLGFEQTFKNALTGLPIGGGKGGSDLDPKGKSDAEIKRFCQSFMTGLYRHIGPDIDVPAGDMGVGSREIGYLYGQYRRIKGTSERGVLTGKGVAYGGSLARKEATGYGVVYFTEEVLKSIGKSLDQQRVIVSGSGNVAIYTAEKALEKGAIVIGISDSKGYILDEELDMAIIKLIKEEKRSSLSEYPTLADHGQYFTGSIFDHQDINYDIVFPCATQNEIDIKKAKNIIKNGCFMIVEGANMPNNNEAITYYHDNKIIFVPGKASNAGGVATSALEMAQNSMRLSWSFTEVDQKLQEIMRGIHQQCLNVMNEYDLPNYDYVKAANIAAMKRVIEAMIEQGDY